MLLGRMKPGLFNHVSPVCYNQAQASLGAKDKCATIEQAGTIELTREEATNGGHGAG